MPLQNRVTSEGEIVADRARGLMMGNRGGALHGPDRKLGRKRWVSRQWICCLLQFNGRHREVMAPRRYTELFFLDEATALAAGHRPCFECRRADFLRFATLWASAHGGGGRATAGDMDKVLHSERLASSGSNAGHRAPLAELPDGSMIRLDGAPHLVLAGSVLAWSHAGYGPPRADLCGSQVEVLTPRSTVAVLSAGYRPMLHPSAHVS
ncbi:MAG TPA: hypothetical protein VFV47_04000 [Hyphomicrobiaceae bacterium]|nr:hypothetical protein [Hyphomicrobiaceae bacterium]